MKTRHGEYVTTRVFPGGDQVLLTAGSEVSVFTAKEARALAEELLEAAAKAEKGGKP